MSTAFDQLKQHLETDSDFQTAYAKILQEHLTPMLRDLQELSKTAGIEITADELGAGIAQANAALSDADLSAVAGGGAVGCSATTKGAGGACAVAAFFTGPIGGATSAVIGGTSIMVSACID